MLDLPEDALEQLCRIYWYPLYVDVRRRGNDPHEAEELTQEFFARLLERQWLGGIQPEGGRFRSFLLTMLNRFLANEWDRSQARKRGGGQTVVSLEESMAEDRYRGEPASGEMPELAFDRAWAMTMLEQALAAMTFGEALGEPSPARAFGDFELIEELGRGGAGAVVR